MQSFARQRKEAWVSGTPCVRQGDPGPVNSPLCMDVRCERCNAEYEFDDSLLGDHGTTVKCSSCGHVFRVAAASRQPSRPSLKVRFARDGRIEPLSSLRDLQRRIHAGEAGLDDYLGREGFPWRKLSDVPELRSFFVKPSSASGSANPLRQQPSVDTVRRPSALSVSQSSMPAPPRDPPSNANRTIQGVGPQMPQIPRPPRVPSLNGPAPVRPVPAAAPAPTAQDPRAQAHQSAPNASSSSDAPTDPPPATSGRPRSVGAQPVPSNPVQKLYLAEDEAPPARATESSSRIWIIAGVAGAVVLGGVLVAASLRSQAAPPGPPPVPRVEAQAPIPAPAVNAPEAPEAPAAAANTQKAVGQPAAPEPSVEPTAAANQPEATAVEPSPVADSAGADHDKTGAKGEHEPAQEATPRDYSGFVAQGDAALARGDGATAEKAYQGALGLRASGSEASTGLGYALLTQGKGREALPHFERASRNGYAEASIGLGDAHKKLGDADAARKAYQSYIDRLPGGARAAYAKKQLELLGGEGKKEAPSEEPSAGPSDYRPAGELVEPPPAPAAEPSVEATP